MTKKKILIPVFVIAILIVHALISSVYNGFATHAIDKKEKAPLNISIDRSDMSNIKINAGGNFDSEITSIKYTDEGLVSKDQAIEFFSNSKNKIYDITSKNNGGSAHILAITIENAVQGKNYTLFVTFKDGTAYVGHASVGVYTEGKTEVSYQYKPSTLSITAKGNPYKIVKVKIAKSSEIEQNSDFKLKGTELKITEANEVNVEYEIREEGVYKIYIEDEKGNTQIKETNFLPLASKKTIDVLHEKGNVNKLKIIAKDEKHNITAMKVLVSDKEATLDKVKGEGTEVLITKGKEVQGSYTIEGECSYVNVYIEDEYGYSYRVSKVFTSIEEDNTLVIPEEPETPEENPTEPAVPETPEENPTEPTMPEIPEENPTEPVVPEIPEENPTEPTVPEIPEENPTEPVVPEIPEENPTEPVVPEIPEENPTEPAVPETPEENPTEPVVPEIPEENPTEPTVPETPEENPTEPVVPETPEENPTEPVAPETPEENSTEPETPEKPEENVNNNKPNENNQNNNTNNNQSNNNENNNTNNNASNNNQNINIDDLNGLINNTKPEDIENIDTNESNLQNEDLTNSGDVIELPQTGVRNFNILISTITCITIATVSIVQILKIKKEENRI